MDSFDAIHLDGTENVQRPFWSPDSRYLAFFAQGQLKKVLASGGPTQLLCEFAGGSDGSRARASSCLMAGPPIPFVAWRTRAACPPSPSSLTRQTGSGHRVAVLPPGRPPLSVPVEQRQGPVTIKVASLDSSDVTTLVDSESRAEYSSGHIFYVAQHTLMARPFSADRLVLGGEPFPVTDRIQIQNLGLVDFSTSQTGDLAYANDASGTAQSPAVARSGRQGAGNGRRTGALPQSRARARRHSRRGRHHRQRRDGERRQHLGSGPQAQRLITIDVRRRTPRVSGVVTGRHPRGVCGHRKGRAVLQDASEAGQRRR